MKKIVVGVSDAVESKAAIDWAMDFAADRAASVMLVHVVATTWGHAPEDYVQTAMLEADEQLGDQAQAARELFPGVVVESHARFGSPVNELITSADGASYFVIGAREQRHGGASRRTVRLVSLAPCSVIVVPAPVAALAGVVAGVDGSVESDLAVQFAAELADKYRERLTVIHAWGHPEAWGITEPILLATEPSEEDRTILSDSIAGLAARYPGLDIRTEISGARPEQALDAAASGARMLVVGSRSRHGLAKALLGSVSEAVVSELPCAVAVIRGDGSVL